MTRAAAALLIGAVCVCVCVGASAEPALASGLAPSAPTMAGAPPTMAGAGTPLALRLADAIYLGLQQNRAIRAAYIERIAQKFDLRVAEDRFTPKLLLGARYQANRAGAQTWRAADIAPVATMTSPLGTRFSLAWSRQVNPSGAGGQSSELGLSVIQPLLRDAGWDVNTAPVRLARMSEASQRLGLKRGVAQTVSQIVLAYRQLLRAQEQLAIARDGLARSRQLLRINRALIDAGRMAEFDLIQAEADAATQELNVEEADNQRDASRLELSRLLALDRDLTLHASDDLQARPVTIDAAEARRIALANQPDYLIEQIASAQAAITLKVAANQRLWDIALVGGANRAAAGAERRAHVGLQLEIPLGDLSRQQGELRARTDVAGQALRLAESRQTLEQNVGAAVRDIGVRWRQYGLAQRARDLSVKKLDVERQKLTLGRSSNFQVLSFESDLRNAENSRLNALLAYLNAQTELDLLLGMTLESWQIEIND